MKPLIALFLAMCSLQVAAQAEQLPMEAFNPSSLSEGAVLLDVRTPAEFNEGHLPGAVNIDWFADDFNSRLEDIPKDAEIYLYCKKGGRSARASERLLTLGYTRVVDLTGGYDAYQPGQ
ncbi:rhodanese-like domain-containing protein [Robiginitalea biformata]|nr:rhodanese-like domain-containing protein [Robiginitalea biformata]